MSTPCLLSLWRTRAELDGDTGDLDEDTGIVSDGVCACDDDDGEGKKVRVVGE